MTSTLSTSNANAAVSRAILRVSRYFAPFADLDLLDDTAFTFGERATLTIGDLAMVGTVLPGGAFGGTSAYCWIGGAGTWSAIVALRIYHDENGLLLSRVAADLAQDAKEIGLVLGLPDRNLGQNWTRPEALGRDLLDALSGGQWWIDASGVTHLGPRPSSAASSSALTVADYDPELRRAVVQLADDAVAQLLPGATLTADGLPSLLPIGQLVVHVEADSIEAELWGERTGPELLQAIVAALTSGTRYHREAPFTVASDDGAGHVAVQPADARAQELPDAPALTHVPGLPGASCVLQRGAGVLVAWIAGDPGSPVVRGYVPGVLPTSITLAAQSAVNIGGPSAASLAKSDPIISWAIGINAALASLGHAAPSLGSVATTIARGV